MSDQQKTNDHINQELHDAVFGDAAQVLDNIGSDKELSILVFGATGKGTTQALDIFTNPDDLKILDPGIPGLNGDNEHDNTTKEVS